MNQKLKDNNLLHDRMYIFLQELGLKNKKVFCRSCKIADKYNSFELAANQIILQNHKTYSGIHIWWAKKMALWYDQADSYILLFGNAVLIALASAGMVALAFNPYILVWSVLSYILTIISSVGFVLVYLLVGVSATHENTLNRD